MKRIRNVIIVAVVLVALIAIGVLANRKPGTTGVTVALVKAADFTVKLPESGVLQHPRTETVPALVPGNVAHIYVRAGERVAGGQLLATLYNPTLSYNAAGSRADYDSAAANIEAARIQERNARVNYQAQVDTNKSAFDEAKRVYDADVVLYNNKAIPRQQLEQDKAKLDQARVAYEQALEQLKLGAVTSYSGSSVQSAEAAAQKARIIDQQNQQQLAFTQIVAPFGGVIQTVAAQPNDPLRPLQPGDAVTAGQALFTIAEGTTFIVRTKVDEQDISQVALGQRAVVSGEDFGGQTFPGHVAAIAPTAQKSDDPSATTKQVLTVIALDRIAPFMKDGMSADVDILTTDLRGVVVVPNAAIVRDGSKKIVWVLASGKASKRAVATGRSNDTSTVVTSGLHPGETIVTSPPATLKEGQPVAVASASPSPAPQGT